MNRKTILGAIVAVGVLVAIMLLSLALVKTPLGITQADPVSSNLTTAVANTGSSFVYINGQEIVQYNYTTGKSTVLSPAESQPGLNNSTSLSVSSDGKYMLFHNEYAESGGILNGILQQDNLNDTLDYWWVFNVQTKSLTPLPQGILVAKFGGDKVYALSAGDNISETITTYNAANGQSVGSLSVPSASNFFLANGGYLLETANDNILFTKNGVVSTVLFKSTNLIGVTNNQQWAFAITGQASLHPLVKLNLQNDTTTVISNNVTDQQAWLNSGAVFYTTGTYTDSSTLNFYSYDIHTGKNTAWNLPQSLANPGNPPLTAVSLLGPTTALISNSISHYYLIGNKLASTKGL